MYTTPPYGTSLHSCPLLNHNKLPPICSIHYIDIHNFSLNSRALALALLIKYVICSSFWRFSSHLNSPRKPKGSIKSITRRSVFSKWHVFSFMFLSRLIWILYQIVIFFNHQNDWSTPLDFEFWVKWRWVKSHIKTEQIKNISSDAIKWWNSFSFINCE